MKHLVALLSLVLVTIVFAPAASAHTRSVSYSRWDLTKDGARVELRIPTIELTRFESGEPPPSYFAANLMLLAGGEPCASSAVERDSAPDGWAIFRWTLQCARSGPRAIESRLLRGTGASHIHFARVSVEGGAPRERFLIEDEPLWMLDEDVAPATQQASAAPRGSAALREAGATIVRYIGLGVRHIALGWDHLAFLFALLLLAGSFGEVAALVSAFTLAHSLTLVLAATGVVRPQAAAVETVIGFSIALIAAENVWLLGERDRVIPFACVGLALVAAVIASAGSSTVPALAWLGLAAFSFCHFGLLDIEAKPARLRAVVAFVFGLVHGLGFAGVLLEIDLPAGRLVPALFGFNTGVELGQLAVVAMAWPLLWILAERSRGWRRLVAEIGSVAIFAVGVFWTVVRGWA